MSSIDLTKLIAGSMFDSLLNYNDQSASVTCTGVSVASGHFAHYSVSVPINNDENFSQLQIKYSFDSTKWYVYPLIQLTLDSNFTVTTVANYTGSNLVTNLYVVNQSSSTATHTSFTVTVHPYLIATPS